MSGHKVLRGLSAVLSGAVLATTIAAGSMTVAANHLAGNVTQIDISDQVGERVDHDDMSSGPMTMLLMGSDTRSGTGNSGYGRFEGARSDTTMLVHFYADRESAVVVSIPRDLLMTLPECVDFAGSTLPEVRDRFNAAFDRGGPGCTVKAVERLSGLRMDHFVVLDFNGFKNTVDALGGVEVCLTRPLVDRQAKVDLPAGRTRVSGEQALGFVRVRHHIGDGSDISRINRQQLFLSSLIQEVTGSALLTDPIRLWNVLEEATKSVATDPGLADPRAALALGKSLARLSPQDVTFVTLPWQPSGDGATVVAKEPLATAIWEALGAEQPWPPPPTGGTDGQPLVVAPSAILVDIRNATGRPGQATQTAAALRAQGFGIQSTGIAAEPSASTTIGHTADRLGQARTLQAALPGSVLELVEGQGGALSLTLGTDFGEVVEIIGAPGGTKSSGTSHADQDVCTG